jgi:hypothetical protein
MNEKSTGCDYDKGIINVVICDKYPQRKDQQYFRSDDFNLATSNPLLDSSLVSSNLLSMKS